MILERWAGWLARGLSWTAGLCLAVMMMVTIADVALRAAFNRPVFGAFEAVELLLVCVVFLALPKVFLNNDHITVDVIDQVAPAKVARTLKAVAALLTLVFVALLSWNMIGPAFDAMRFGETTLDLKAPIWVFWLPMLLGLGASLLGVLAVLRRVIGSSDDVE